MAAVRAVVDKAEVRAAVERAELRAALMVAVLAAVERAAVRAAVERVAVKALLSTPLLLSRMMSSPAPCGGMPSRHKHWLLGPAHHIMVSRRQRRKAAPT